ncbi:DEAD/DEAH box helicase [Martelella mediterranea]|uniref:ATP-dependent RNA helicase DeaD n=1 Tax=Martelella mediterranea TaxID=293089 RepID=A0A4V2V469_9HYPH|nr:DEAD/DEAH box helicase [Martelella mediterranea]TCT37468.1 ATP-dependent RNA helicase DeaD [Martelella mediterranea]
MTPNTDTNAKSPMDAIHPALASALAAKGYSALTPVQMAMTNEDHGDSDLLVSAQTGSGKTVAFGIAIAPTLLGSGECFAAAAAPLALVIAPTRELAIQVQRELDWLYAAAKVQIATCVGGMDMRNERRALERGAHIVVGTPGRLRDHIMRRALDLSAIRAVVLDEADEMLDLGFRDDLEFILGAAPQERRTLLFSATVRRGIAELARTVQTNAVRIETTGSTEQHADIEYQMMLVRRDEREHAIINTLLDSDSASALVFCHTREAVRHLTARLANRGFAVVSLSGEMAQSERSNALQSMRDGRSRVCVATDVAARGIDLPNLDLVVHADVPSNPETLLHRSGRTGRAGRKGVCVLIVPQNRRGAAQRVLTLAKLTATVRAAPGIADIEARNRRRIIDAAASAAEPDGAEAEFVAELLNRVEPERIAVAFLRQQLAAHPVPEELLPLPAEAFEDKKSTRARRGADKRAPVREPRGPDMQNGVWFTISLGRKQRADPKFLLPMICNAGGVTKRDVGVIRIEDTETRFEIAEDKAAGYAEQISQPGSLEKGIRIAPAGEVRGKSRQAKPKFRQDGKPSQKHKAPSAERSKTSKHKGSRKPKRNA